MPLTVRPLSIEDVDYVLAREWELGHGSACSFNDSIGKPWSICFHGENPLTGESLGVTMTYQELQVALYSLYIKLALERDAA